jgi:hypothetical protein
MGAFRLGFSKLVMVVYKVARDAGGNHYHKHPDNNFFVHITSWYITGGK